MKKLLLCILILALVLSGCAKEEPVEIPQNSHIPAEDVQEEMPLETPSPVTVSPLAEEQYLLPFEDYSWERECPAEFIMLHFTSAVVPSRNDPYNIEAVRKIFEDNSLSIHYIIDRDGKIFCYIPEDRAAWHAGKGAFADDERLTNAMNKYSIGIEILAIGSKADMAQYLTSAEYDALDSSLIGFTDAQYSSLKALLADICQRNSIPFDREHIIGHDEYNSAKSDPGELFRWEKIFN